MPVTRSLEWNPLDGDMSIVGYIRVASRIVPRRPASYLVLPVVLISVVSGMLAVGVLTWGLAALGILFVTVSTDYLLWRSWLRRTGRLEPPAR